MGLDMETPHAGMRADCAECSENGEPFKSNVHFYRLQYKTDKTEWRDFDASLWDLYAVPLQVKSQR